MTYEECLRTSFFDYQSWSIALIGLGIAFGLIIVGRRYVATAVALLCVIIALLWAVGYYEMNCIELYQG